MHHLFNVDSIILFFFLGMFASWIKSDLEIPKSIAKFLSIYLLLSLGIKGGHEVRFAEDLSGFAVALLLGMFSCVLITTFIYYGLRKKLGGANASALAACYGAISAVSFITARGALDNEHIQYSGYMVAVMALMETPSIILALYFYESESDQKNQDRWQVFRSILTCKSVVLLLGGFLIGLLMDMHGWESVKPVVKDSFKGILAFFLLDLGIAAQHQLVFAWRQKVLAIVVGVVFPLFIGAIFLFLGRFAGMNSGDQILLAILAGSASYIAAPAAIRMAIVDANPGFYLAWPLALTFPITTTVGIPLYMALAQWVN